jgi:FKBP-type peptidyl-prolyl cis-trans isomerase FklB
MIRTILSIVLIAPVVAMAQPGKPPAKKTTPSKTVAAKPSGIRTSVDSFSYAIGMNIASNLKSQGITKVNNAMMAKAFNDVFTGATPALDMQASNQVVQQKFMMLAMEKSKPERDFLEQNKKKTGVKTTSTGLQYEVIKMGTGATPTDTSTVKVHYTGTLINGKKFDSSVDRGEPIEFPVTGVIPGWTEALKLMPVGSKWKLYIPAQLGYGERGQGDIPPGATLIFDVELLDIVKAGGGNAGQ